MRGRSTWLLLVVSSLGGLTCSESGPSFKTTVTAQGEGETNTAPLWPLRLGARWGSWVVTEVRREGGEDVHVLATEGSNGTSTPTDHWPLLVVRKGAIYGLGTTYHRAATPILVVPATVRVGMKWETRTAGGALLFSGSVDSRESTETSFGTRVVWGVSLAVGGPAEMIDNSYPYPLREFAGVSPGRLIEGMGPDREDVVVPLDSQDISPPTVSLAASPLGSGPMMEVDELGFITTYISASIEPTRQGGLPVVKVRGLVPFYRPPGLFIYDVAEGCGVLKGGVLEDLPGGEPNAVGLTPCPDGAAVVGGSQIRDVDGGRSTGIVVEAPPCFPPGPCPPLVRLNTYSLDGIFATPGGGVRVLAQGDNGFVLGDYDPAGPPGILPERAARGFDRINAGAPLGWLLGTRGLQARPPEKGAPLSWITAGSGDRLGVAQFRLDDRLFWYRLEGGQVRAAHASAPMPMRSVTASPDGRVTLSLSPDGRVDRVDVTVDGIEVRPLGRVALPAGSWLAGGFVQGGDLIAVVQRGFVRSLGAAFDPPPILGAPWLYRVALPAGAPVAAPPAVFGVRSAWLDDDVLVCWRDPAAGGAADLTGWTLRGRPPLGVLPVAGKAGETCVLVAHDPEVTGVKVPGVEAKLPGVGRVLLVPSTVERLRTPRPPSFAGYFDVLAAAGDDLFISHAENGFEYGDLGLPQSTRAASAPAPPDSAVTPDNHGRWAVAPDPGCGDCAQASYIKGGMTVRTVMLADAQARMVSAYNDGSAVARVKTTLVRIAADGSTTTVAPIAAAGGDVAASFVSRTGAACSFAGSAVLCRGADGVVRTGPPPPPYAILSGEPPLHETLDGHIVGIVSSSTDPESMLRSFDIDPERASVDLRDIPGIAGTSSARCNWFPLGAGRDGLVCQRPAARAGLADVLRSFRVDGSGLHALTIPRTAPSGPFLRVALWGTPSALLVYRQRATDVWDVVRVPSTLIVEGEPPACSNGVDDDRDGIEDLMDLGCADGNDRDETNPAATPQCGDGRDNDNDQTVDFPADEQCRGAGDPLEGEEPICDGTACAILNGTGTAKHVDVSSGGVFAAQWYAASDTTLTRLEAHTGLVSGPAWIAIYAHNPSSDEPGAELARADFTLDVGLGWQGAKLPTPVVLPQGTPVWWVVSLPARAQPPYAEAGTAVQLRTKPPGVTVWRHSVQAVMMRAFCCEK